MTERSSPLTQRVRRLLGTGTLAPPEVPQYEPANGQDRPDTGALFESQIAHLSQALRDLHAIDRQREAELRALRELDRQREAELQALREQACHGGVASRTMLVARIDQALAEIEALIAAFDRTLAPVPLPTAGTLFERMRAQAMATISRDHVQYEALTDWVAALRRIREHLRALRND